MAATSAALLAAISMAEFEATSAALSMAASETEAGKAGAAAPVVAMADVRRADPGADLQRVSQQRLAAVAAPCRLAAAAHWRPWRLAAVAVRSFAARGGGNLRRSAACNLLARLQPASLGCVQPASLGCVLRSGALIPCRSAALGKLRKGTYDRCRRAEA